MAQTQVLAMYALWPWSWEYDLRSRSWHTLRSWTTIEWNYNQIELGSDELWSGHGFLVYVHSDIDLRDMTLGQGHDTPLGHGQQLCEILSRSDKGVHSYGPDTMWTDGQTDRVIPIYIYIPPPNFVCRGYNDVERKNIFSSASIINEYLCWQNPYGLSAVKQRSRDYDPFWPFCHCFDVMISPSFIAFAAKTIEMNYDVMKYATFSRGLWLAHCKTCSFHSILQRNLTFSLLTWLGSPIFLFYLLVRTTNFLWLVFNKIWMIRFFAVVNYMIRKFSFCSNFYADAIANIILLHIFINLKIVFYSWNMILKLKSFIQIGTFIIHKKRLTLRVAINLVDETRYCTPINHLDTPL